MGKRKLKIQQKKAQQAARSFQTSFCHDPVKIEDNLIQTHETIDLDTLKSRFFKKIEELLSEFLQNKAINKALVKEENFKAEYNKLIRKILAIMPSHCLDPEKSSYLLNHKKAFKHYHQLLARLIRLKEGNNGNFEQRLFDGMLDFFLTFFTQKEQEQEFQSAEPALRKDLKKENSRVSEGFENIQIKTANSRLLQEHEVLKKVQEKLLEPYKNLLEQKNDLAFSWLTLFISGVLKKKIAVKSVYLEAKLLGRIPEPEVSPQEVKNQKENLGSFELILKNLKLKAENRTLAEENQKLKADNQKLKTFNLNTDLISAGSVGEVSAAYFNMVVGGLSGTLNLKNSKTLRVYEQLGLKKPIPRNQSPAWIERKELSVRAIGIDKLPPRLTPEKMQEEKATLKETGQEISSESFFNSYKEHSRSFPPVPSFSI